MQHLISVDNPGRVQLPVTPHTHKKSENSIEGHNPNKELEDFKKEKASDNANKQRKQISNTPVRLFSNQQTIYLAFLEGEVKSKGHRHSQGTQFLKRKKKRCNF